jgi:hypothetical protein
MSIYTKEDIKQLLQNNVGTVTFTKTDGTERVMKCTLQSHVLPITEIVESKVIKTENPNVLSVWDLDNNGWRSFKIDSVLSLNINI